MEPLQPPQNTNVPAFLQEMFQRLTTKSPKFFKIIQWVTGIAALITGVPQFLEAINVQLPELWSDALGKTIAKIASGMFFISLLTTQSKAVGVTKEGEIIKKTDTIKLPFTTAAEIKAAEDNVPTIKLTTPKTTTNGK